MGPARIYPWRKMRRSRAPSIAPGTFFVAQSWADCITNMAGFNLRQAQDIVYAGWLGTLRRPVLQHHAGPPALRPTTPSRTTALSLTSPPLVRVTRTGTD